MPTNSPEILSFMEKISEHYNKNIYNRYIRKALVTMDLDATDWSKISKLTDEQDLERVQGYRFVEIYEMILSMAKFIHLARTEISPHLKFLLGSDSGASRGGSEDPNIRILREIAISNFKTNLGILSDLVHQLYMRVVAVDKDEHSVKSPVFERIPELKDLGQKLVQE